MANPHQLAASIRDDQENFAKRYQFGRAGELEIQSRLKKAGYNILATCQIVPESGHGGPRIVTPTKNDPVVADFFVWRGVVSRWIEVKHKSAFSWYRKTSCWVTGINLHQYRDYQEIERTSPWPLWLFFLHDGDYAIGSPFPDSPSGLFGNKLSYLTAHEHHRATQWGSSGMVYWAIEQLEPLDREAKQSIKRF